MRPEHNKIKYSCARCKNLVSDQFNEFRCKISNNKIDKKLLNELTCDNFKEVF